MFVVGDPAHDRLQRGGLGQLHGGHRRQGRLALDPVVGEEELLAGELGLEPLCPEGGRVAPAQQVAVRAGGGRLGGRGGEPATHPVEGVGRGVGPARGCRAVQQPPVDARTGGPDLCQPVELALAAPGRDQLAGVLVRVQDAEFARPGPDVGGVDAGVAAPARNPPAARPAAAWSRRRSRACWPSHYGRPAACTPGRRGRSAAVGGPSRAGRGRRRSAVRGCAPTARPARAARCRTAARRPAVGHRAGIPRRPGARWCR